MAKTNWQYGEIVTEEDFNQLGQEVNEATAGLAVLEEQLGEAEQSSKAYTDQQIQLVTATGIPKLVTYTYVLEADQQGQTDFEIPLETFVKETDTVTVARNSTVLSTERYSVVDPKIVRLAEGVNIGTEIFVQVWKNVPIGPDGAISASVLANDTVTESKMADEMKKDVPGGVAGYDSFAMHLADFTQQIPYAVTAGSANAYTASTTPPLPALVAGVAITVKFHAENTGVATLNWNGKGAKAIKKANGSDVSSGNLKLNGVYTLRYDGTNFILQGEGGIENDATAVAADILTSKTAYVGDGVKITGTMPNTPSQTATLQITGSAKPTKVVPAGYTPGGTVTAELAAALANRILAGNTIGGVAGTAVDGAEMKKFAIGSARSSTSQKSFPTSRGGTSNQYYINISGLSFVPSIVIASLSYTYGSSYQGTVFRRGYSSGYDGQYGGDTELGGAILNLASSIGTSFDFPISPSDNNISWIAIS
ncbi:hypothetical protein HMPREF0322_05292 [Desulfitobacterium hafniense DP7]|uniref:Uncharacterized protein n=1 Tax=Desulfitobacterium hafniense DP7 TaxID=537010 RepID=G9XWC5_DESHA|nr:hypothetical protein [Desulfitobacterium hafniense]EHL04005.1 hypothetical protein HMPREF0322_05292 [Desulfitobacterium hafniense DP7]